MSGDDDSSGWQLTESDPGVFTLVISIFVLKFDSVLTGLSGNS